MSPRVMEIRSRVEPVLASRGVDLEDVSLTSVGRREVVTIVVDRDGGVDLDVIAEVSTEISGVLDQPPSLFSGAYVLEVTSPGVDRPLTEARHWRRAVGRLVTVERATAPTMTGRVIAATSTGATIAMADGSEETVEFPEVSSARIEVEFDRKEEAG